MKSTRLHYFYDPMCSWCWGYRPTWLRLQASLADDIEVHYTVGGLAPDTDQLMPEDMQRFLQQTWQRIHKELGATFNFDFWQRCLPRRSTYASCRAVLAAERQGHLQDMLLAIQEAYYLRAMNPSDQDVLIQLAQELGLDVERFVDDLNASGIQHVFEEQLSRAKSWPISGFPSLVLEHKGRIMPVVLDYKDEQRSLDNIHHLLG